MKLRHVPYAVGLFLLWPYALWLVLWATVFPGPKHGFDEHLAIAMFAVSVPLVAWFFVSSLGFVSNNIGGGDEFDEPGSWLARMVNRALPVLPVLIGIAMVPYLLAVGEPSFTVVVPLGLGLVTSLAILAGERGRARDRADRPFGASLATKPQPRRDARTAPPVFARLIYAVPVIGRMLREAVEGDGTTKAFFAANVLMMWALAVIFLGYPALIVMALALSALVFVALIALAWPSATT